MRRRWTPCRLRSTKEPTAPPCGHCKNNQPSSSREGKDPIEQSSGVRHCDRGDKAVARLPVITQRHSLVSLNGPHCPSHRTHSFRFLLLDFCSFDFSSLAHRGVCMRVVCVCMCMCVYVCVRVCVCVCVYGGPCDAGTHVRSVQRGKGFWCCQFVVLLSVVLSSFCR